MLVVLINSAVLGLQTSSEITSVTGDVLAIIDRICLYIFVAEAVLKIIALRLGYFKKGWNWFDFIIVVASIASDMPAFSSLRTLRIVRVFRALKFISGIEHLQVIVSAIGRSIPSIGWTTVLMLLFYYMYGVIGTMLFGTDFPEFFGTIGKSMFSLFQIMTLESWSMDIGRPVMEVFPFAWLYFVSFIIASSFVALNIVVGIVVNSISEISSKKIVEEKTEEDLIPEKLQIIRENLDAIEKMMKK